MKKLGILLLACITALNLWAEKFKIGKLTFEIISSTEVSLTKADQDITKAFLSETIDYEGNSYTLTYIGSEAFKGCSSLTSVTIPNSVTSIGGHAFEDCTSLTSVRIPNSVTSLWDTFSGCSSLTSVTIPNSVTSIDGAFSYCSSLTSVTIPNSVKEIGGNTFWGTALYKNPANWENGALYIDNCLIKVDKGFAGHFRIKENTRVIAVWAFSDCSALTSVTIPNSVTSIGLAAFSGCSALTSVTIPNSVTSIRWHAFEDCTSLTSVRIPNSVTSIGGLAFKDCSSLTSVTIPNSVTSIEWWAFKGCSSLTSITIPNSVTSIGEEAFEGTALYKNPANWENGALYINNCLIRVDEGFAGHFRIKENTRLIAGWAFYGCSALTSVTIPNSVTRIGDYAFGGCSSLSSPIYNIHCFAFMPISYSGAYTIPNSIKQIAGGAFKGCSALTSVTIPNSVRWIGKEVFLGTALYKNPANWENGALYIDDCLIKVANGYAGHFRIKENTRVLADGAFIACRALTSVTIPNSVTSIGNGAFYGCSALTSVTIPNSVTSIDDAFPSHTEIIRR